jgi:capsular polysaccharide biosynthesis protein
MTLLDLITVLRRRGWILLLLAALTAGSAYVFSQLQIPVYESSVRLLIQPARPDFGLTEAAKTTLRSYVQWIKTRENAQRVIDLRQLDRTPESLLGDVTVASEDENFVIQIDVRNQNGDLANDIARTWAELFVQWRDFENTDLRREDHVSALMLDTPTYTQFSPQTVINTLAGGILGLLLGGLVIFALEYLESNIIRSRQDAERALGLTVLGAIPALEAARRKG